MKSSSKKSVHARTLTFLTASFLFLSLTGCSDTDDASPNLEETTNPKVSDTPETSDTPEYVPASEEGPAQNVPEPRLPASATERSEEGAKGSLTFFWQAEEHARQSGDTSALETVSTEACEFCAESITGWSDSFAEGIWSVAEQELEVEITDVMVSDSDESSEPVGHVFFELHEPATQFYDSHGLREEESFAKPEATDWFALLLYDATAQRWKVDWVGLEEAVTWEE